jgi:hypothetical protein
MKKAYAAYAYKTRDKSKDKERKEKEDRIRKWLKDNPDFRGLMEMTAFDIVKGDYGPDGKMDTKLVKELLKKSDLTIDFSAYDLLKVWRKT